LDQGTDLVRSTKGGTGESGGKPGRIALGTLGEEFIDSIGIHEEIL
jgi:hypothetical protein